MVNYSSTEAIDSIRAPDDNVEIRAYVDHAPGAQGVGTSKRLNLFKFVINNGSGKRIMCLAWEKEIPRIESIVQKNKILHIEAAQAKPILQQRYNLGNASFELNIRKVTKVQDLGMREEEQRATVDAPVVSWDDVVDKEAIVGWIKFPFTESPHFNNESSYGFGSITDGRTKLEVRLTSLSDLPNGIEKGVQVKITGTVCCVNYPYIKLDSGANVVLTGGEGFNVEDMLNITRPPTKRQRTA